MTDGTQIPEGGATPSERPVPPAPADPRVPAPAAPRESHPDDTMTFGRVLPQQRPPAQQQAQPAQQPQPAQQQPQQPSQPQPQQSAPGYGYPQQTPQSQQPTQYGYGYPQAQQQPAQQPQPPQQPFNAFQQPQTPFVPPAPAPGPDWTALAEEQESRSRRVRRWRTIGIVAVACVLGVGVGWFVIQGTHKKADPVTKPTASVSAGPTAPSPTPPSTLQPGTIPDTSGQTVLATGPDAKVSKVAGGDALQLKADVNSFAQASQSVVDVQKSFTVSAWVYTDAALGSRSAISQGDGVSYSFDLGRNVTNGHKTWMFKVQTADGGADSTSIEALSPDVVTTGQWVLLTGTYDTGTHHIVLYVNGKQAATAKVPGIWSGSGPLEVGRARYHGVWANFWEGTIGHIQVWDRSLSSTEVAGVKSGAAGTGSKPVDSWMTG